MDDRQFALDESAQAQGIPGGGAIEDLRRRRWLLTGIGALGVGIGFAKYLDDQPRPPAGSPTMVDIAGLPPGKLRTVDWAGRTVWILRRRDEEVSALIERETELLDPTSEHSLQPEACRNRHRSLRTDVFVAIGLCTHQGCSPQLRNDLGPVGEFLCPCHTARYDLAGRVFRGGPAPANLVIPEHHFADTDRLVIGES